MAEEKVMTLDWPQMRWVDEPETLGPLLRKQLLECWRDVSNAGGAVGFPFSPVSPQQVLSALEAMLRSLNEPQNRLLLATIKGELAGWLFLAGNSSELTAHWAQVRRVQTALGFRRLGVGKALMTEVARAARDDLKLEQLHLELRSGRGLEAFYKSCGWQEVGRWPAALRFPDGDHDEILMVLSLTMKATFSLRRTTPADWSEIRHLRLEMIRDTPTAYAETVEEALGADEAQWRKRGERGTARNGLEVVAIAENGSWVGTMGAFVPSPGTVPLLVGVYVAPAFRGPQVGVADALLASMEEWARAQSNQLTLHVHEDNVRARKYYERRGFTMTGQTFAYKVDPAKRELEMVKEL
ncbi:GNAT family N-acetyltransferase [Arthrobacter cryoconiti]|uniref:GNAT family N-acetyltransferase n=1 Tax=Arthrobacter cryoconiti TaxID=748907 RepID=A0ABV8R1Y1_9MICC|nr:GNAT family N-acetyltransferase [Arthrobacter cryoconiti]MCC9067899.1 GNAT family N-acetyltransferase [Arthrobacter cryoconiti]